MTVIAADLEMMAADRRQVGDVIATVDKILLTPRGTVVGAAGDWDACLAFLDWAGRGFPAQARPTPSDADFDALELAHDGLWLWTKGLLRYRLGNTQFFAIGSGAQGAMVAMYQSASPDVAVQVVSLFDESCGNGVQAIALPNPKRKRR